MVRVKTRFSSFNRLFLRSAFQCRGSALSTFRAGPPGSVFAAPFADRDFVLHVVQLKLFTVLPFCILSGHLGRSCSRGLAPKNGRRGTRKTMMPAQSGPPAASRITAVLAAY